MNPPLPNDPCRLCLGKSCPSGCENCFQCSTPEKRLCSTCVLCKYYPNCALGPEGLCVFCTERGLCYTNPYNCFQKYPYLEER